MNKQELIEKINEIATETPFPDSKIVDLSEAIELIEQLDEPIKLKDVIKRIKDLDIDARKVWIDAILNELGSDYGSKKYRDGYEQGRFEGEYVGQQLKDADKVRQELNKPTVPQIVADYIKYTKDAEWDLQEAMDDVAYEDNKDLRKWFNNNIELFARAWIDGYTVEKEKRYRVKMKGHIQENILVYGYGVKRYFLSSNLVGNRRAEHTKKQLEEDGFSEVFNNPLFEVEEVE
ncbi:DUF1642 domain-containing protein [Streptococcus parasanguinis]|uniref:DUF1642 domain-containing protein n=1 Tax=Streptococcus parasanguinis TaxID=1318 RepID=UPI001898DEA9|nr:DUF1642 domain-containing protein [Streptococcus parasanguinis]MDB8624710.1 DUF1642 domain-containing protein [Streptococcus parasanguinis]